MIRNVAFSTTFLKKFVLFAIVLSLFAGVNVLRDLGYMIGDEKASGIQKLLPSFVLMVLAMLMFFFSSVRMKSHFNQKGLEIRFLIFIIILMIYVIANGLTGNIAFIPNTLILPLLLSLFVNEYDIRLRINIKTLLLVFYIANSSLAIVERLLSFHLFTPVVEHVDYSGFRATALQNHPLNNALITTIIMSFILTSDTKLSIKYLLFFLGFVAVICFGSRSSILGCTIMLMAYVLIFLFSRTKTVNGKKRSLDKLATFGFVLIGAIASLYLITSTSFGERLMNTAYFDDSASVRLDVLGIFGIIGTDSLLWGASQTVTEGIQDSAGVYQIENFWVIWILRFGLILGSILIVFFVSFLYKKLRNFDLNYKILIISVFLGIATTNISLGSTTVAITVFVLCTYAFKLPSKNSIPSFLRN